MRQSPFQASQSRQFQVARIGQHQNNPFQHIQQMMVGFGGFPQDPFFNSMMMMPFGDPFQDMFNFSNIHKNVHNRGVEGSYVCQSFVSSSKIGADGKIVRQNYFQNSMGENRGGQTISQKQQAYKNTEGVNRIAQQRMLNDKGRKIVRQKRGNQYQETNHYYNIDEQQAQQFDNQWGQTNKNLKFLQNYQKYLRQPQQQHPMQIGYEPMVQQQPQQQQYYQYQRPNTITYNNQRPYQNKSTYRQHEPQVRTTLHNQQPSTIPPQSSQYQRQQPHYTSNNYSQYQPRTNQNIKIRPSPRQY